MNMRLVLQSLPLAAIALLFSRYSENNDKNGRLINKKYLPIGLALGIHHSIHFKSSIDSQKVIDKIFQPFFTTKPTEQGTGLGLSLSYDIIKVHGGEIKVETKGVKGLCSLFNYLLSESRIKRINRLHGSKIWRSN